MSHEYERPRINRKSEAIRDLHIVRRVTTPDAELLQAAGALADQIDLTGLPRAVLRQIFAREAMRAETISPGDGDWRIEATVAPFLPPDALAGSYDVEV